MCVWCRSFQLYILYFYPLFGVSQHHDVSQISFNFWKGKICIPFKRACREMVIPKFSLLKRSRELRKMDLKFVVMTSSKSVLFVMTSFKNGCFCNDVIKNRSFFVMTSSKKGKKHYLCVFSLMTSSQYIYMYYVRIAPLYWKNFWA